MTWDRDVRKWSPSLVQLISSYFKHRNSATSGTSLLSLLLEIDSIIKKVKKLVSNIED